MKKRYKEVKIGAFCKTSSGGTPRKSDSRYYEGGSIPWLLSGEVNSRHIFSARHAITEIALKETNAKLFPKGTVLVAMYGATAGQVGILRFEAATNQAVCGIYPDKAYQPEYLYYALLLKKPDLVSTASGNAQPNISQKKIRNTEIQLPPLPEQKRIVAVLDQTFAGIDKAIVNTERNLANARELFESYLKSIFSRQDADWLMKPVGEMADHCLGKMLDKRKNKGRMRPYLRNVNVQWFDVSTDDLKEIRIEEEEIPRYSVEQGDLLICEGGYPGRAAIWDGGEQIFFQKALHRVRCQAPVYNYWLLYYLYYLDAVGELPHYFTGTGIQHFTGKALKALPVAWPLEPAVAKLLAGIHEVQTEVRELVSVLEQKRAALAELKQSLLQKAFAGELTADDVSEAVAVAS